jgi:hypothetical protein
VVAVVARCGVDLLKEEVGKLALCIEGVLDDDETSLDIDEDETVARLSGNMALIALFASGDLAAKVLLLFLPSPPPEPEVNVLLFVLLLLIFTGDLERWRNGLFCTAFFAVVVVVVVVASTSL